MSFPISQPPAKMSHLEMLDKQVHDLARKGDTKTAAQVLKMAEEIRAQMANPLIKVGHIGDSGGGGGIGYYDAAQDIYRPTPPRPYTYEEKLAMRMGWGRPEDSKWAPGFEHVAIHHMGGGSIVHIWIISKEGQSHVLEDELGLFPSDALVTKLNLLKG